MEYDSEIFTFLIDHLGTIQTNNVEQYHASTSPDLSLYEWWVTPHRIDGLPFHDFMMEANASYGKVFGSETDAQIAGGTPKTRFDLANLRIQRYGDTAIASYTLLTSTATEKDVLVVSHNESRVMIKLDGNWKVVHVHKSPAWQAPHIQPWVSVD